MSLGTTTVSELDSRQLYYCIISGAKGIFEHQKTLNKINVFPVADADTGTNLASTMRSIVNARIPVDTPKQTAIAIADAAISGARGNSGIIFAQFLYGFSNEMTNELTLDIQSFAESMKKAVAYAYDAIANPVEGTILTVIKDWADQIYKLKDIIDDFIKLLWEAYQKALESLASTTKKLEVLARTHVVDAGAKGFVYFLEGLLEFFTKDHIHAASDLETESESDTFTIEDLHEVITFRYCTEALIAGEKIDKNKIHDLLLHDGDSLVVAGSPSKLRIHLHCDRPDEVFAKLKPFGELTYQKVDDMVMQHEIMYNRKADIAVFTDSTCDLPKELLDQYQIHVIPLMVQFGESYYLDRMTIQPGTFYTIMQQSEQNPTSSQPTTQDFINKYEFLSSHYKSIVGVHLSNAMSGTYSNSLKSAAEVSLRSGRPVEVVDAKTVTGGLGLIVLRMAQAVEAGIPFESLTSKTREWIGKSHVRVTVPTLKYIIRSGRVSPFKSFVARVLDLKPVISLDQEGKAVLKGKSFSRKGSMRKAMKEIRQVIAGKRLWGYCITHADAQEAADWYASEMEKLTGQKPLFVDHASPVLVAHTGHGVACVSLMLE